MIEHDPHAPVRAEAHRAIPEAGLLGRLIDRGGAIFAAGVVVAAAVPLMEVFLRYVFNAPTIWAHELTVFLCGAAFVYGGLYCAAKDRHIRVVMVYDLLPPDAKRTMDVVISLTCAAASGIFAMAAWTMVQRALWAPDGSIRLEGTGSAWDPPTPALIKAFLLVVLGVMALQFLIIAVNHARRAGRD